MFCILYDNMLMFVIVCLKNKYKFALEYLLAYIHVYSMYKADLLMSLQWKTTFFKTLVSFEISSDSL